MAALTRYLKTLVGLLALLQQLRRDLRQWAQQNPFEQQYVQQIVDVRQPQRLDFPRCNAP